MSTTVVSSAQTQIRVDLAHLTQQAQNIFVSPQGMTESLSSAIPESALNELLALVGTQHQSAGKVFSKFVPQMAVKSEGTTQKLPATLAMMLVPLNENATSIEELIQVVQGWKDPSRLLELSYHTYRIPCDPSASVSGHEAYLRGTGFGYGMTVAQSVAYAQNADNSVLYWPLSSSEIPTVMADRNLDPRCRSSANFKTTSSGTYIDSNQSHSAWGVYNFTGLGFPCALILGVIAALPDSQAHSASKLMTGMNAMVSYAQNHTIS